MAPPFDVVSIRNAGPTDNSGLDTLYVVQLREGDAEASPFRFWVLEEHGRPDDVELEALIRRCAAGFANDRSALEQFRELERPHPKDDPRRTIQLWPRDSVEVDES